MRKTFKFRLFPTDGQRTKLKATLEVAEEPTTSAFRPVGMPIRKMEPPSPSTTPEERSRTGGPMIPSSEPVTPTSSRMSVSESNWPSRLSGGDASLERILAIRDSRLKTGTTPSPSRTPSGVSP